MVPSKRMHRSFVDYAVKVKALLAETFGLKSNNDDAEDYYFGGSYLAGRSFRRSRSSKPQRYRPGPEVPAA